MKVLPFTIPVAHDKTIIVQEERLPYFYPHLHRHEEIQLTLILEGEGNLLLGNHVHRFSPNELYLIGANIPHVFKSDHSYFEQGSKKNVCALTLFFSTTGKLASLFDLPELKQVHHFFSQHYSGFKIPEHAFSDLSSRMFSIQYASGMDQLMQFFQLLKMLSSLEHVDSLGRDVQPKSFNDHEGARISSIYNFIMQYYNRDITLQEVADAAFMTPQAFCRYFKKHTRLTFISFLNEVRINEACKRLIEGKHESIAAVAYGCGFNSITNFNRVFKASLGKSPKAYVSSILANVE